MTVAALRASSLSRGADGAPTGALPVSARFARIAAPALSVAAAETR